MMQGISFYDGAAMPPYKIVYFLLGGLAILVGIVVVVWLPDSPVNARMLTQEERIASLERVRDDQGGTENKKFKREQVIETLLDVRTWLVVLATMLSEYSSLCSCKPYTCLFQRIFLAVASLTVSCSYIDEATHFIVNPVSNMIIKNFGYTYGNMKRYMS